MHTSIRICTALLTLTLLAACDEGESTIHHQDVEFRKGGECIVTQQSGSSKLAYQGHGFGDLGDPFPWREAAITTLQLNMTRDFAESRKAQVCHDICTEFGLEWGGEACIADGGFDVTEPEVVGRWEDLVLLQADVYGEAQFGCSCG